MRPFLLAALSLLVPLTAAALPTDCALSNSYTDPALFSELPASHFEDAGLAITNAMTQADPWSYGGMAYWGSGVLANDQCVTGLDSDGSGCGGANTYLSQTGSTTFLPEAAATSVGFTWGTLGTNTTIRVHTDTLSGGPDPQDHVFPFTTSGGFFGFCTGDANVAITEIEITTDGTAGFDNVLCESCTDPADYDADLDGYTTVTDSDCDDANFAINPGATEVWYDDIDQDCAADDDFDQDGDSYASLADVTAFEAASGTYTGSLPVSDCADADATINPGATEVWYDDVDQDCGGDDDFDQDADDHASITEVAAFEAASGTYTGTLPVDDCDDSDDTVHPGATDTWYDGVDSNCDLADDYDQDGDGHASDAHSGDDCDDTDDTINPSVSDKWYDGLDQDCDGGDDYDYDGDGYPVDEDCDDADADAGPGFGGFTADCERTEDAAADDEAPLFGEGQYAAGGCSSTGAPNVHGWLIGLLVLAGARRRRSQ